MRTCSKLIDDLTIKLVREVKAKFNAEPSKKDVLALKKVLRNVCEKAPAAGKRCLAKATNWETVQACAVKGASLSGG